MIETSTEEQVQPRENGVPATLDLAHHFRELRRVILPALLIAVLAAAVVFAVRSTAPKRWEATVTTRADSGAVSTASGGTTAAASLVSAPYLALASDGGVLHNAAAAAGVRWDATEAKSRITVREGSPPGLLLVSVLGDSVDQAAAVARQAVLTLDSAARNRQVDATAAQVQQTQAAANSLNAQLQALPPTDPTRATLQRQYQSQLDQIAALQVTGLARLSALADPVTSSGPVSPQPWRDAALALLVVLIVTAELLVLLRGWFGTSTSRAWARRMARRHKVRFADCASRHSADTRRVETLVIRELSAGRDVLVLCCPPLSVPVLDPRMLDDVARPGGPGTPVGRLIELDAEQPWWRLAHLESTGLGLVVVSKRSRQRKLVRSVLSALTDGNVPAMLVLLGKSSTVQPVAVPEPEQYPALHNERAR